jgi:hypothetical protein
MGRTLAGIDPLGDMRMVGRRAIGNTLQIGSTHTLPDDHR